MKITLTCSCRRTDSEEEAEFDTPETIEAISRGLVESGHEVCILDAAEIPVLDFAAQLRATAPDLIFNTVEGREGRLREAFYPALFEMLGYPFVGSDAHTLAVTLDKWLTKLVVAAHGVRTPRAAMLTPETALTIQDWSQLGVPLPVIVKPNFEGSSKGISDDSVAFDEASLRSAVERTLDRFPAGVLVEEYVAGIDVTVPIVEGVGPREQGGVLTPAAYRFAASTQSRYNLYDYRSKNINYHLVDLCCPAAISEDLHSLLRATTLTAKRALGIRDMGRADFRLREDGRIYFLEVNALPSLAPDVSLFMATALAGLSYAQTLGRIVENAAARWGGLARNAR